ncbi:MAG: hypothetical protein H6737_16945 [Alphaproteobacteria bacterium]|nr:hypothetical protein [Alphaproteobacteria bacterium]
MSGVAAMGMLLAAPGWAEPPSAPPEAIEVTHTLPADDLRELRLEMRAIRESLDEERRENLRLREELLRPHASLRTGDRERVGFGQRVRVENGEEVGDVVSFGNDVLIDGVVRGDATAFGGSVLVTSRGVVEGDALSFGGEVRVEDGGRVLGDKVALEDPTGTTAVRVAPESGLKSFLSSLYHRIVLLLSFAGAGILVIGLFPNRVDRIAQGLEHRPLWSAVLGTLATVLLTVFSVLFALLTLGLGSPVSALLLAWLGAAWLFGFVGLCQAIGDRLPFADKPHGRWLTFLVGTVLLSCIGSLPWVGWLVVFAASMLGVGASITSRFGGR